jgi:hypothetical protein
VDERPLSGARRNNFAARRFFSLCNGAFAETKECLAGFFVIDCEDLDHTLEWAKKIPSARLGSIEIRPVRPYSGD